MYFIDLTQGNVYSHASTCILLHSLITPNYTTMHIKQGVNIWSIDFIVPNIVTFKKQSKYQKCVNHLV